MKKVFWFTLSFISLLSLQSLALDNPYASGGSQYGGDDFYLDNTPSNSSYNSNSSYSSPSTNSALSNTNSGLNTTNSPYSSLNNNSGLNNNSSFSNTNNNTNSGLNINSSDSGLNAEASKKPWSKVENWFQRKSLNKNANGQPELDLANQRIQAGKARIRAIKAKEKLDSHVAECQAKTQALTEELNRAEEQAALIENQVKFQEGNKI